MKENKKFHYFYKITNLLNNHFYYGIHSTNNLDDGYIGSGTRLQYAYKKYGVENFKKEILKFFNSRKECAEYEAEMVTEELVHNPDCYNVSCGGEYFNTLGTVPVKSEDGKYFRISKYDEKWTSGKLKHNMTGIVVVKDKNNNVITVPITDERYLSGELVGCTKGEITVKDKNGNHIRINIDDPRYLSGELVGCTKGEITVKDKNGNYFNVLLDDPRYLSGELKSIWYDRKHKDETRKKMSITHKLNKNQQGEKNSQFGTCWIYKDGENKKIKKDELELYIQQGWIKGRKIKK